LKHYEFDYLIVGAGFAGSVLAERLASQLDQKVLEKPRGKQNWQLDPHAIWYPRTTGIWRRSGSNECLQPGLLAFNGRSTSSGGKSALTRSSWRRAREKLRLSVKLWADDLVLAHDQYTVVAGEVHRRIALSDPGSDDFRNELLWSPVSPKLIDAELALLDEEGVPSIRSRVIPLYAPSPCRTTASS
jgi:hypothetical protein